MERERLLAAVGAPELRWIWERIHARVLRGRDYRAPLRHASPTRAERDALSRLLGRMPRGEGLHLSVEELESTLREAGLAPNLVEAAKAVLGVNASELRERRMQVAAGWDAMVASATLRAAAGGEAVAEVIRDAVASGLLRRLSARSAEAASGLTDQLLRLTERLPARGVPLAQLAAEVARDAHALDEGTPLGTLGVRLAARVGGLRDAEEVEDRREAWARAGVLCDELSGPALALNLLGEEDSRLGQVLRLHAAAGDPVRLSVRQLVREMPRLVLPSGRRVFICENPSVVAAAASSLGPASAPLICTEGMPRTAVRLVLDALRAAGAELGFHADFDWAGVRIGNLLAARHAALPWRMSLADYLGCPPGPPLAEGPVAAVWDAALQPAMSRRGLSGHEEAVLSVLLEDLAENGRPG